MSVLACRTLLRALRIALLWVECFVQAALGSTSAARVPMCSTSLAAFLSLRGFPGDEGMLARAVAWLEDLEVTCAEDFVGLGSLSEVDGATNFPSDVIIFMAGLASVCRCFEGRDPVQAFLLQDARVRPMQLAVDDVIIDDRVRACASLTWHAPPPFPCLGAGCAAKSKASALGRGSR